MTQKIGIVLHEVQQYFKQKLLAGEFEIRKVDEYRCTVLVGRVYTFVLWVGDYLGFLNMHKNSLNLFCGDSFMHLDWTDEEFLLMLPILMKKHDLAMRIGEDLKLDNLKKEIKTINNNIQL